MWGYYRKQATSKARHINSAATTSDNLDIFILAVIRFNVIDASVVIANGRVKRITSTRDNPSIVKVRPLASINFAAY